MLAQPCTLYRHWYNTELISTACENGAGGEVQRHKGNLGTWLPLTFNRSQVPKCPLCLWTSTLKCAGELGTTNLTLKQHFQVGIIPTFKMQAGEGDGNWITDKWMGLPKSTQEVCRVVEPALLVLSQCFNHKLSPSLGNWKMPGF